MRRFFPNALVSAVVLAVGATPSAAQESTTRGFVIGLHASGASLQVESQDRNNAGGAGLLLGYGVNRHFTIFAQADAAQFDNQSARDVEGTWVMGHFDLGVRFNFANSLRSYVPFLQGSIGARAVGVTDAVVDGSDASDVGFTGASLTLGGGIDFYFTETFALDLALLWSSGKFDTLHVGSASFSGFDIDARSARFNIGVVWWP